jgi:hypothetical protein
MLLKTEAEIDRLKSDNSRLEDDNRTLRKQLAESEKIAVRHEVPALMDPHSAFRASFAATLLACHKKFCSWCYAMLFRRRGF